MPSSMPSLSSAPSMSLMPTTSDLINLFRLNCGGLDYIDSNGNLWRRDADAPQYYQSGSKYAPNSPPVIQNTNDEVLFQSGTSPPGNVFVIAVKIVL